MTAGSHARSSQLPRTRGFPRAHTTVNAPHISGPIVLFGVLSPFSAHFYSMRVFCMMVEGKKTGYF
jgi:hypothetical protein